MSVTENIIIKYIEGSKTVSEWKGNYKAKKLNCCRKNL